MWTCCLGPVEDGPDVCGQAERGQRASLEYGGQRHGDTDGLAGRGLGIAGDVESLCQVAGVVVDIGLLSPDPGTGGWVAGLFGRYPSGSGPAASGHRGVEL